MKGGGWEQYEGRGGREQREIVRKRRCEGGWEREWMKGGRVEKGDE